jgi:hypothetical protein
MGASPFLVLMKSLSHAPAVGGLTVPVSLLKGRLG